MKHHAMMFHEMFGGERDKKMECLGDAGKLIFEAARDGDTVTVGKMLSTALRQARSP
jgi:hypothetical protein